jgi:hypothetical protein
MQAMKQILRIDHILSEGFTAIKAAGTTVALGIGDVTGLDWSTTQVVTVTGQNGTAVANDIELQVVTITQMK